MHLDVRSEAEWEAVVDGIVARHGGLDVLVNNAAIDMIKRLDATTLDEWNNIVAINQTGMFLGMRTAALAMMKVGRGGSIVNISSVAGLEGVKGHGAYSRHEVGRARSHQGRRRWSGVATASA